MCVQYGQIILLREGGDSSAPDYFSLNHLAIEQWTITLPLLLIENTRVLNFGFVLFTCLCYVTHFYQLLLCYCFILTALNEFLEVLDGRANDSILSNKKKHVPQRKQRVVSTQLIDPPTTPKSN